MEYNPFLLGETAYLQKVFAVIFQEGRPTWQTWWFSLQKMWGLNSWLKPPAVVVVALTCYKRKSFVSRFFGPTEISTKKKSQMGDLKQRSNLKTCSFKKEIRLINLPFKKEEGLLLDLQSPFEFWWICGFFYMYSKDQITKNFRYLEWRY